MHEQVLELAAQGTDVEAVILMRAWFFLLAASVSADDLLAETLARLASAGDGRLIGAFSLAMQQPS